MHSPLTQKLRSFAPKLFEPFSDYAPISEVFTVNTLDTPNVQPAQSPAEVDQAVAQFLLNDPDFLNRHPEILVRLRIPNQHGEEAVSLTARQVSVLREKIAQLEDKLEELIGFGIENDEIGHKTHAMVLSLITAADYRATLNCISQTMQKDFNVPYVAMRLWNLPITVESAEFEAVPADLRFVVSDMTEPYCGTPTNTEALTWFDAPVEKIRSIALIPLSHNSKTIGLLALGSEDPKRFFPEMGTLYIARMGQMVAAALHRQLAHT